MFGGRPQVAFQRQFVFACRHQTVADDQAIDAFLATFDPPRRRIGGLPSADGSPPVSAQAVNVKSAIVSPTRMMLLPPL